LKCKATFIIDTLGDILLAKKDIHSIDWTS